MAITLATAWHPRGEIERFLKLLPVLQQAYTGMAIAIPPSTEAALLNQLQELQRVEVIVTPEWSWGRYLALERSLKFTGTHIQYADFDRLLRWVETREGEWRNILQIIQENECTIIGRSPESYQTHPQALIQTEAISNQVVSYLVGQPLDISAGSKGFSREAAEYLVAHCEPGYALGTDAEWPLLLKRAGFHVTSISVDGLDWESADRYRLEAADTQSQKDAAGIYDADPQNWARRVGVAKEIVEMGFKTMRRDIAQRVEKKNLGTN